jgi:hypothetical protein
MATAKTATMHTAHDAKRQGEQIATSANFSWLARLGYAARGMVYIVIGGLAVMAAGGGGGGQMTGSRGALQSIADEPYGQALLVALGIGLLAFGLWRAAQAIADTDGHGTDGKGMAIRLGFAVSAVTHAFLAVYAASIAFSWGFGGGGGSGSGSSSSQSWSAWLLGQPGGRWILGFVGLAVVVVGVAQIVKGWKAKYQKYLVMDWQKQRWADPVCKFGLIARGVVFGIIGAFIVIAAYQTDPSEVRGLGGALRSIQGQTYGTILLLAVALGLIAFGIYSIIEAIYRRIQEPT